MRSAIETPAMAETPSLLTIRQAATLLACSVRTVQRMLDDGRLRAYKLHPAANGHVRLRREDVLACLVARAS